MLSLHSLTCAGVCVCVCMCMCVYTVQDEKTVLGLNETGQLQRKLIGFEVRTHHGNGTHTHQHVVSCTSTTGQYTVATVKGVSVNKQHFVHAICPYSTEGRRGGAMPNV